VVARYAELKHDTAAVLLDVDVPVVNGLAAAEVLRAMNPAVKVLLVSGLSDLRPFGSVETGPNLDVLAKPFSTATLLDKLGKLLEGPKPP
jgi:FixJ family two-component response regulator